jgi:hypothetical protein
VTHPFYNDTTAICIVALIAVGIFDVHPLGVAAAWVFQGAVKGLLDWRRDRK